MLLSQTGQVNKHWKGTAKVTEKPCVSFLSDFSLCVCVFFLLFWSLFCCRSNKEEETASKNANCRSSLTFKCNNSFPTFPSYQFALSSTPQTTTEHSSSAFIFCSIIGDKGRPGALECAVPPLKWSLYHDIDNIVSH